MKYLFFFSSLFLSIFLNAEPNDSLVVFGEKCRTEKKGDTTHIITPIKAKRNISIGCEIKNYVFNKKVELSNCTVHVPVIFESCHFKDTFDIRDSSNFGGKVVFKNCVFDKNAFFAESKFQKSVEIIECIFKEECIFDKSSFDSGFDLTSSQFNGYTGLEDATFKHKMVFVAVAFNGAVGINRTFLPDTLDMSYSKNQYEFDFTGIYKMDDCSETACNINLQGASIEKLLLPYGNGFRLYFSENPHAISESSNYVYLRLLERLKETGLENSYRLLDLEYKKIIEPWPVYYWQWIVWDHGYRKYQLFIVVFVLLLSFTWIILKKGYKEFVANTYKMKKLIPGYYDNSIRKFLLCFTYVSVLFFGLKLEIGEFEFHKNFRKSCFVLFIYTTGLVFTAYIAHIILT